MGKDYGMRKDDAEDEGVDLDCHTEYVEEVHCYNP